jgi:hypothetical protein
MAEIEAFATTQFFHLILTAGLFVLPAVSIPRRRINNGKAHHISGSIRVIVLSSPAQPGNACPYAG